MSDQLLPLALSATVCCILSYLIRLACYFRALRRLIQAMHEEMNLARVLIEGFSALPKARKASHQAQILELLAAANTRLLQLTGARRQENEVRLEALHRLAAGAGIDWTPVIVLERHRSPSVAAADAGLSEAAGLAASASYYHEPTTT